jgi:hypothetical protein
MEGVPKMPSEDQWPHLKDFSEPYDEDERKELELDAEKHGVTTLQFAKIHYAVARGTDFKDDPQWIEKVQSVAQEIGEEKTKAIIEDYTNLRLPEDASLEVALKILPHLSDEADKRARQAIGGVLDETLPDATIVERESAEENKTKH